MCIRDRLKEHFDIDVTCVPVKDISNIDLDVLFATGWETAYPVFNMKTNAHKMYFVQDYEQMCIRDSAPAVE